MSDNSWFTGVCGSCKFPVVVTQPDSELFPHSDYQWYCSNPSCENHTRKTHTGDMEVPNWLDGTRGNATAGDEPEGTARRVVWRKGHPFTLGTYLLRYKRRPSGEILTEVASREALNNYLGTRYWAVPDSHVYSVEDNEVVEWARLPDGSER
jgi:hypothetical protein